MFSLNTILVVALILGAYFIGRANATKKCCKRPQYNPEEKVEETKVTPVEDVKVEEPTPEVSVSDEEAQAPEPDKDVEEKPKRQYKRKSTSKSDTTSK